MRYRNIRTGIEIDVNAELFGDDWEKAMNPEETNPEVTEPETASKTKKTPKK